MTDLLKYRDFAPTSMDVTGLGLPDRQDWLVVPAGRSRDSGPMEESNFDAALNMLGDESEGLEVHRFGHWGPGWIEIILVHPSRASEAEEIHAALDNYPLLDESDYSARTWAEWERSWEGWICDEFRAALLAEFPEDEEMIDAQDVDTLHEIYCDCAHYYGDTEDYSRPEDVAREIAA